MAAMTLCWLASVRLVPNWRREGWPAPGPEARSDAAILTTAGIGLVVSGAFECLAKDGSWPDCWRRGGRM